MTKQCIKILIKADSMNESALPLGASVQKVWCLLGTKGSTDGPALWGRRVLKLNRRFVSEGCGGGCAASFIKKGRGWRLWTRLRREG